MCIIGTQCDKITEILHKIVSMCLRTRNTYWQQNLTCIDEMVTYRSVFDINGLSTNYDKIYGYIDIYGNLLILSEQLYHTICIYEGIFSNIIRGR